MRAVSQASGEHSNYSCLDGDGGAEEMEGEESGMIMFP